MEINADLCNRINMDIAGKKTLMILGSCDIEYAGRSKSSIGPGHRMIIIKQDSTVLIHSITGFKPVNWMNTPTETVAELDEGLVLRSQRTKKPFEEMKISLKEILDFRSYASLRDDCILELTHTEKELQEHLAKNPNLVHPEFRLISTEHPTPLGFFDLYGKIKDKYAVVELKVEKAGLPAALQIKRYRDWLAEYVGCAEGMLIAPGVTPNALLLLRKERIEFKKMNIHYLNVKRRKDKTLKEWF